MEIQSFITNEESSSSQLFVNHSLHPDQLVIDALSKLIELDVEFLPIVKSTKYLGMLYTKDLVVFLSHHNKKYNLLFHKFNFDIRTAIHQMIPLNIPVLLFSLLELI